MFNEVSMITDESSKNISKDSSMVSTIQLNLDKPEELERIYRENPKEFEQSFWDVKENNPGSKILEFWGIRLKANEQKPKLIKKKESLFSGIGLVIIMGLLSGTLIMLLKSIGEEEDPTILVNALWVTFLSMSLYYMITRGASKATYIKVILISLITAVFLNYLNNLNSLIKIGLADQSLILAFVHIPVLLWVVLSTAYVGKEKNIWQKRSEFLIVNGELIIIGNVVGGCFGVLTMITYALFSSIDINIEIIFQDFILFYLFGFTPILTVYLSEKNFGIRKIMPYISKIVAPLLLLLIVSFSIVSALNGRSIIDEREFLILFDFILIACAAVIFFIISERHRHDNSVNVFDYINLALCIVVFILDIYALSGILYRTFADKITPNRIATIGANILIMVAIGGFIFNYFRFFKRKSSLESSVRWITGLLPIYGFWAAFVGFVLPLIYVK